METTEFTIKFSAEQQEKIMRNCGFVPKPIVTDSLNLMMLSMSAIAQKSIVLPLVNRMSTLKQIIESLQVNSPFKQPFSVILELSTEQREAIKNIVNVDWNYVAMVPDDYDIHFKQHWGNEALIQKIGENFVIVCEGADYLPESGEIVIKLPKVDPDQNQTFGTGSHPTTQTILSMMESYKISGSNVLDIGTGSGILAVAAAKMGAVRVLATDIDATAVETAKNTAILNNVSDKIQVLTGSVDVIEENFDFVTANLFPKIIIPLAQDLADKVAPNGLILVSGLVSARIPEIIYLMHEAGLEHIETKIIDFWAGLSFRKTLHKFA